MKKRILLTTGRAPITLELARQLKRSGHTVFVADTTRLHITSFSNTIEKSFKLPSPRFHQEAFIHTLCQVIEKNKIDVLIPMWEEILYISKVKERLPASCKVFADSFDLLHTLHNKWLFNQKQKELNILCPKTYLIKNQEDLSRVSFEGAYILKLSYSRASQNMHKVLPGEKPPTIEFDETNPWIAQEWLEGKKYCTYGVCQNGKLKAHAIYPVNYAIDDSSCLTFQSIHHPEILNWVKNFVKLIQFTGQIAFDFIETPKGLFAIECNPRATSGIHLFQTKDQIDQAFLEPEAELIEAQKNYSKQIFTGMMLYGWKKKAPLQFTKHLLSTPDVVFDIKDLTPFILQPLALFNYLKWSYRYRVPLPCAFTFDLNWNGDGQTQNSRSLS